MVPDIMEILANSTNLQEAINTLIVVLDTAYQQTNDLSIKEKVSAIQTYDKLIHNKKQISSIKKTFNSLYKVLDEKISEMTFTLEGNKKPLRSFLEKIDKLQSNNSPLDSALKDIQRFRIVITDSNTDSEETINNLYLTAMVCIRFFIESGYTLCQTTPLNDVTDFDPKLYPNICVPSKSLLPVEYLTKSKDYVLNPKSSGYQSIHLLLSDVNGNLFEVQIRTFAMHIHAECSPEASHLKFKKNTRKTYDWDLSRINIAGFKYVEIEDEATGKILFKVMDNVGLIEPVPIFLRVKTFY